MGQLTVFSRFLLTMAIVAGLFFGGKYLYNKFKGAESTTMETSSTTSDNSTTAKTDNAQTDKEEASNTSSSSSKSAFTFTPTEPSSDSRLKGVVELGASGFNSFVVRIDKSKNWKMEKSEFGNSLVYENMASDDDITKGLKAYISGMLNFGVAGKDIHFVVSSGAVKAENTQKIVKALKGLKYFVNTVSAVEEGQLALRCVLPIQYAGSSFVTDIGSGNTKISWMEASGTAKSLEAVGAKYFQNNTSDTDAYTDAKSKASQVPQNKRRTCFIIGGVPFELAKKGRNGKERYTVLNAPSDYTDAKEAKTKAGLNIYKAIAEATNCDQFVFDWDANFTIGYLLKLPY